MSRLELYVPPPPVPKPACASCTVWAPECLVPAEAVGRTGAPLPMCWLCAHAVTEHGATLEDAVDRAAACGCGRSEIFPAEVVARRLQTTGESGLEVRLHAEATRSLAVPARVRQAQNRRAASMTARSRLSRRRAEVHADRLEPADLPET